MAKRHHSSVLNRSHWFAAAFRAKCFHQDWMIASAILFVSLIALSTAASPIERQKVWLQQQLEQAAKRQQLNSLLPEYHVFQEKVNDNDKLLTYGRPTTTNHINQPNEPAQADIELVNKLKLAKQLLNDKLIADIDQLRRTGNNQDDKSLSAALIDAANEEADTGLLNQPAYDLAYGDSSGWPDSESSVLARQQQQQQQQEENNLRARQLVNELLLLRNSDQNSLSPLLLTTKTRPIVLPADTNSRIIIHLNDIENDNDNDNNDNNNNNNNNDFDDDENFKLPDSLPKPFDSQQLKSLAAVSETQPEPISGNSDAQQLATTNGGSMLSSFGNQDGADKPSVESKRHSATNKAKGKGNQDDEDADAGVPIGNDARSSDNNKTETKQKKLEAKFTTLLEDENTNDSDDSHSQKSQGSNTSETPTDTRTKQPVSTNDDATGSVEHHPRQSHEGRSLFGRVYDKLVHYLPFIGPSKHHDDGEKKPIATSEPPSVIFETNESRQQQLASTTTDVSSNNNKTNKDDEMIQDNNDISGVATKSQPEAKLHVSTSETNEKKESKVLAEGGDVATSKTSEINETNDDDNDKNDKFVHITISGNSVRQQQQQQQQSDDSMDQKSLSSKDNSNVDTNSSSKLQSTISHQVVTNMKRVHLDQSGGGVGGGGGESPDDLLVRAVAVAASAGPQSSNDVGGKYIYAPTQHYHLTGHLGGGSGGKDSAFNNNNNNNYNDHELDTADSALLSQFAQYSQPPPSNHRGDAINYQHRLAAALSLSGAQQQQYQPGGQLYSAYEPHLKAAYAYQQRGPGFNGLLVNAAGATSDTRLQGKPNDLYFLVMVGAFCMMAMAVVLAAGLFAYRVQQNKKSNQDLDYPTYGVVGPNNLNGKCGAAAFVAGNHLAHQSYGNRSDGSASRGSYGSKSSSSKHLPDMYATCSDSGLTSISCSNDKTSSSKKASSVSASSDTQLQQHQHRTTQASGNFMTNANNQDAARMYHYQHQKQQMIISDRNSAGRHISASDLDSEDENEDGSYTVYECPGLASAHEMEIKNPLFNDDQSP